MRERPILFSDAMVRAILAGTKTVTRRVVKPQPPTPDAVRARAGIDFSIFTDRHTPGSFRVGGPVWAVRELMGCEPGWRCPYGAPGDRLWVREAWRAEELADGADGVRFRTDGSFTPIENTPEAAIHWLEAYAGGRHGTHWRPSIHMPRWASRLTLEVKSVRVERLQDLSEEDARAEGVEPHAEIETEPHKSAFAALWDSLASPGAGWTSNPWVWRVAFERVEVPRG